MEGGGEIEYTNILRVNKLYLIKKKLDNMMLETIRALLGFIILFFLPGYAFSYVLYPGKELQMLERIALSIGLSISLVVLSVLVLNTILGVAINLMNSLLIILSITLASALTAIKRKKQINTEKI